jgi:hypothetical protein
MAFMQKQIIKDLWVEIDGGIGVVAIPASLVAWPEGLPAEAVRDGAHWKCPTSQSSQSDIDLWEQLSEAVSDFYGSSLRVWSIEIISGFGVRLSAPGYMDCTDWTDPVLTQ